MKKLSSILLALVMSLSLVACGGPDKQPAIDAFNSTSAAFNEVAKVINADAAAYPQELIDVMVEMAGVLNDHQALLQGDTELSEEDLDGMIEWYGEVNDWIDEVKEEYFVDEK